MHIDRIQVDVVQLWCVGYRIVAEEGLVYRYFTNEKSAKIFFQTVDALAPITTHEAIKLEDEDKYYLLDKPLKDVYHMTREEAIEQIPENAKKALGY